MGDGRKTEIDFANLCKKLGHYHIKLQIDRIHLKIVGQVLAKAMPADFIVITTFDVKFVEVKEVETSDRFDCKRLRQQYKLYKLTRHFEHSDIMNGYVFINFMAYNTICYMHIDDYNELLKSTGKKSFTVEQVPDRFKFTWKSFML